MLSNPHLRYRRYWKVGNWFLRHGCPRIAHKVEELTRLRWAADLPSGAGLTDSVYLMHNALGVVLHQRVQFLGKAVVFQNVTLGNAVGRRDGAGAPTLGDNVLIGAGACLLGPIEIGDNVVIAAGTVVTRSVDANSRAFGNPMQVVPLRGRARLEV